MVEELQWDSNFFGFPVGRIDVDAVKEESWKAALAEKKHYRVIYIFSDHEIKTVPPEVTITDIKVTFRKEINQVEKDLSSISEYDPHKHSYEELLDLVYLSGTYSRFKKDVGFSYKGFLKLYREWIDISIRLETTKVLVKQNSGVIAGFITLDEVSKETSKIGLITVHPEYRGKNLGTQLIQACQQVALDQGKSILEVSTQDDNVAAKNLYVKNGFKINKIKYIYHLWNQ